MNKDTISVKGIFKLQVFCARTGAMLHEHIDKNLVVSGGLDILASMLGGDSTDNVTQVGFGTSSAAPAPTDIALTSVYKKAITSHSYPGSGQVQFDWTLEVIENNSVNIAEYGLFTAANVLLARKVHTPVITKTSSIRLVGSWTITLTA